MPILAYNKRANYDYNLTDKYEAGLVLLGHEVKSVRNKNLSLKGAYVILKQTKKNLPELYLINCHIAKYKKAGSLDNYNPERSRKLLLKKNEIKNLIGKKKERGLTLVPIKFFTKHNLIKLEFALGKGKKKFDKREDIKKKELDRSMRTLTKQMIKKQ